MKSARSVEVVGSRAFVMATFKRYPFKLRVLLAVGVVVIFVFGAGWSAWFFGPAGVLHALAARIGRYCCTTRMLVMKFPKRAMTNSTAPFLCAGQGSPFSFFLIPVYTWKP